MTLTDHSMVNDEMKNVDMKADEINKQKREQSVGNKAPKL